MYRERTNPSKRNTPNSHLTIPDGTNFHNLQDMFEPLEQYISVLEDLRTKRDKELVSDNTLSHDGLFIKIGPRCVHAPAVFRLIVAFDCNKKLLDITLVKCKNYYQMWRYPDLPDQV